MILLLLMFAGTLHAAGTWPETQAYTVTPKAIQVGSFYDGADVRIEGTVSSDSRVIVTVTGSDREEAFNRKARFGPAWLNAGKVHISGAPSLFLRFASDPSVAAVVPGFDEESLRERMQIRPAMSPGVAESLRGDYVTLKKSEGVYVFSDTGVLLGSCRGNGTPFRVSFRWPKSAPPADYMVHVYEIHNGAVSHEGSVPVWVVRSGFPAWMAGMAETRAAQYGITAIVIGVLAGFGIDLLSTVLFRRKGTVAH